MGKAASPALTTAILVLIGVGAGVLLWMLTAFSGSYSDVGSDMDVVATVICYENKSMLVLNVRSFERVYIDSVTVNGCKYSISASVFGENRVTADGEKCPCQPCDRNFVDGELVTNKGTFKINVFVVKALAKPST